MSWIDWVILLCTLLLIVFYGVWKTRHTAQNMEGFLKGNAQSWWMVGLSIMATQASAITFLSTPSQAYEDGMRFVQFYFGLPLAMLILSYSILPIYYRLKVYTAYQYLEHRFDHKTRTLTAVLFLIQRGLSAGLTLYAPSIILATILEIPLLYIIFFIGILVIIYVSVGGSTAVSQTHKQQMLVIWIGMIAAFFTLLSKLPTGIGFAEAVQIADASHKLNILDFKFDLSNRYNFWSGMLGGTFLFLSYFGTDQSQVGRYLSGSTEAESRRGLLMNGLLKIPMQLIILFIGTMVFVFFQFYATPLHFNKENVTAVKNSTYATHYAEAEKALAAVQQEKQQFLMTHSPDAMRIATWQQQWQQLQQREKKLRSLGKEYILQANPKASTKDTDYVFITFILNYLPHGLIGILLAVIFCAAMSSISAEINALASTTLIDIYKRSFQPARTDAHYLKTSKLLSIAWGGMAVLFAILASHFENLIEAVNIVGSLFYGTILGVFLVAFYMKYVHSNAVFWAAVIAEIVIINIFILDKIAVIKIAYLWLNMIGCLLVIVIAALLQKFFKTTT